MPDLGARVHELRAFENLASKNTAARLVHPSAKLLSTLVFIVIVASFGRYDFVRLVPYLFYPFIMTALSEIPYRLLLPRVLIALPFCAAAGISNVILDRDAVLTIAGMTVSSGVLSFATLIIKMYLCVTAALILAAITPFSELTAQLRRFRVHVIFVTVFETTYRYVGVLLEEVHSMTTAYKLRSGAKKALNMEHMGSFVGQLLLRGFDRAERVHAAMSCRGYSLERIPPARRRFLLSDAFYLSAVCAPAVILRLMAFAFWRAPNA